QRIDRYYHFVFRFERLARPSVSGQEARRRALQVPDSCVSFFSLNLQKNVRMWAGELELLHQSFELDRFFLVKHRERMLRYYGTDGGGEGRCTQGSQLACEGVCAF